jgi:hypothetical protein
LLNRKPQDCGDKSQTSSELFRREPALASALFALPAANLPERAIAARIN